MRRIRTKLDPATLMWVVRKLSAQAKHGSGHGFSEDQERAARGVLWNRGAWLRQIATRLKKERGAQ